MLPVTLLNPVEVLSKPYREARSAEFQEIGCIIMLYNFMVAVPKCYFSFRWRLC